MKKILIQAVEFVGSSGIGWILDFCTYTGLGFVSYNLVLNNTISSCVGITFVFLFATRSVFQNNSKISLKWKYIIYVAYQAVLIFSISKLLNEINGWIVSTLTIERILQFSPAIFKILVTPVTMVLNFIVMKGIIEK